MYLSPVVGPLLSGSAAPSNLRRPVRRWDLAVCATRVCAPTTRNLGIRGYALCVPTLFSKWHSPRPPNFRHLDLSGFGLPYACVRPRHEARGSADLPRVCAHHSLFRVACRRARQIFRRLWITPGLVCKREQRTVWGVSVGGSSPGCQDSVSAYPEGRTHFTYSDWGHIFHGSRPPGAPLDLARALARACRCPQGEVSGTVDAISMLGSR